MSITGTTTRTTGDICSLCCCLEQVQGFFHSISDSSVSYRNLRQGSSEIQERKREYFHESCPTCSAAPCDSLCASCKHMRLNHLLQCCLLAERDTTRDSFSPFQLKLNIGCVRDLRQRSSSCHTCDLFTKIADRLVQRTGFSEESSFILSVLRDHSSDATIHQHDMRIYAKLHNPEDYASLPENQQNDEFITDVLFGKPDPLYRNSVFSVRRPNALVDWELVSKWLEDCNRTMGQTDSCYMEPKSEFFHELRVIDVKKRRIMMAPAPCEYASLSYVWGDACVDLQATTKNLQLLSTEGYLSSTILPQVIDDAILACEKLKISYLWVDRLCILQDEDPDKKDRFLNAMGDIYRNSYLTLVALAGRDASHGLTGVNKVVRPAYWTGHSQGIHLISEIRKPGYFLEKSKWKTRGWTFQEGMLSSRLLYFSDSGVFYECCHREEEIQDESSGSVLNLPEHRSGKSVSYREAVRRLTTKDLTWESDILDAFKGILFSRWGNDYHGLPLSFFSDAIFWTVDCEPGFPSHITRDAGPGKRFPSWSWCSVRDIITIQTVDTSSNWELAKARSSLATWAIPCVSDGKATLQLVSNASGEPADLFELQSFESFFEREEQRLQNTKRRRRLRPYSYGNQDGCVNPAAPSPSWRWMKMSSMHLESLKDAYTLPRIAAALAWKHGCFSATIPPQLKGIDGKWEDYETIVSEDWSSLAQFCDEAHCMPKGIMSKHDMETRFPSEMWYKCPTGSIFVYTQSLPLSLTLLESGEISIRVEGGDLVPEILPGSVNIERIKHVNNQDSKVVFNVIALSVRPLFTGYAPEDENVWYDSEGAKLGGWSGDPIKVELMIIATENGFSQRVGLAAVLLRAWINQRPQFNTFHLV